MQCDVAVIVTILIVIKYIMNVLSKLSSYSQVKWEIGKTQWVLAKMVLREAQ